MSPRPDHPVGEDAEPAKNSPGQLSRGGYSVYGAT